MKLLITVVSDRFFLSHFLDRALSAQRAGYQVVVVAPETGFAEQIRGHGFVFLPINLERHNVNPVPELRSILELSKIYREQRPVLVWQIGIKPIVLGTLAVILGSPGTRIVNAPVGLGYVFAGEDRKARLVRPLLKKALQQLLNPKGSMVVFENQEDLREMERIGALGRTGGVVIKGAGVSLTEFPPLPEPTGTDPSILLAARMIEEKGIRVYVAAAQILQKRGHHYRFLLAGGVDHQHSSAIAEEDLRSWHDSGIIEWLGDQRNMSAIIGQSHIFCLPTWHREGIPKVLLEAMATGRAIITTDVVGCRELIRHKKNGWLISPKDPEALANVIEYLFAHPELRVRLAKAARREVEREYASEIICQQTLRVFQNLAPIPARERNLLNRQAVPAPRQRPKSPVGTVLCIIPSFNGCKDLQRLLTSLQSQSLPHDVLVIDSSSTDKTRQMLEELFPNIRVQFIPKSEFGHGKTRQRAFLENPGYEFYAYLTQDAYLVDDHSLQTLVEGFKDQQVGAVCGRQIPHPNATIFAAFSRHFNYPALDQRRCLGDREHLGIKTAFLSNSCSAYRATALQEVGGFPVEVPVSEDLYVGAMLLLKGWCIAYGSTPICHHSHNYSVRQEFRRYQDIGAFHAQQKWIAKEFGGTGGEGLRYVREELAYLGLQRFWLWPVSLFRNVSKFVAFHYGYRRAIKKKRSKAEFSTSIT